MRHETQASLWGLLGVAAFGLTLPATKAAVPLFGFVTVGLGRAVPFVTFFASSILFREQISPLMFLVLAIVLTSVHFGRKAKVIME